MTAHNNKKGFTLIELLVVIGILAVLLTIVLIAINPARQFSQSNNTKRRSDINALLNAVHQFAADNRGTLPGGGTIPVDPDPAGNIADTAADLCDDLVPTYISALPVDPLTNNGAPITDCTAAYDTNYQIIRTTTGRVTVSAVAGELGEVISVTR